jgi:hypothetical protein
MKGLSFPVEKYRDVHEMTRSDIPAGFFIERFDFLCCSSGLQWGRIHYLGTTAN